MTTPRPMEAHCSNTRFASQNLPPSPQPKAGQYLAATQETPPTLKFCVTTPPDLLSVASHSAETRWDKALPCPSERSSDIFLSAPAPPRQIPILHPRPRAGLNLFNCDTLKFPRVPARVSEALVLRTYPLKEADLVVSFLTRDQGKLRGVAKRARRPKSTFGSGLERLSHVRMAYFQRESHELVNLDSCELIRSQFDLVTDYQASIALDFFAEASELLLPSAEPGEKFFRLLVAVLESLRPAGGEGSGQAGRVWRAVTYFSLWAVRLSGWLPELHVCLACGSVLDDPESPQRAFFSRDREGLICGHCRGTLGAGGSWELSRESREVAGQILRRPVAQVGQANWTQSTAADLRRFLVQQMETHAERRLVTVPMLEGLTD
jgi:DNA repair protein RecO (recombination protein O)